MNKNHLFLLLTILVVLVLGLFKLNFYPQLSQGDHGRDLYSAQAVLRGELPYKDFWWVYGPLMPYYFAVSYKSLGSTIVGFLAGDLVLKVAAAAFFYLACTQIIPALPAFLGAVWFVQSQPDFFFTFNHQGGITAELWIVFMLFAFIIHQKQKYLWMTLPAIFCYCLIKINFGLAAFTVVMLIAIFSLLRDRKIFLSPLKSLPAGSQGSIGAPEIAVSGSPIKTLGDDTLCINKNFFLASFAMLGLVAFIYWLMLKDLNIFEIRQCMPYFGDDQPHHFPPSMTIPYYFTQHWLTLVHAWLDLSRILSQPWMSSGFTIFLCFYNLLNFLHHFILHGATGIVIWQFLSGKLNATERKYLGLCIATLGIFFVINFHEFVVSGVWYRTYWSLPFLFMFHAITIAIASRVLPKFIRGIIWSMLGILLILSGVVSFFTTEQQKIPQRLLSSPHGQIYIGNEPQWIETVNAVSDYLRKNLQADETFFALPYDDIYYYLTNKKSPTRMLIFFDHIKIRPEQEMSIIKELERHNVAYVLMSNRIVSSERGLGVFGKTYCPIIAGYINQHYDPLVRQGGNWDQEPGWGNNHGVMLFKRKQP